MIMKKRITSLHERPVQKPALMYRAIFTSFPLRGPQQEFTYEDHSDPSVLGHKWDGHQNYFLFRQLHSRPNTYINMYDKFSTILPTHGVRLGDCLYLFYDATKCRNFIIAYGGIYTPLEH